MVRHEKHVDGRGMLMNDNVRELIKNPEIELLIQPITNDEYTHLEQDIVEYGCRESITIWNNIIIDGHKRYDICCRFGVPYCTRSIPFTEICDVFSCVCMKQLHRQDLTLEYRKYIIGRLYQAETEIRARQLSPPAQEGITAPARLSGNKYHTAMQIGLDYHISYGTVLKYSTYAASMDSIRAKEDSIFRRLLIGNPKVSHENIIELSRLPKEDLKCLKTILEENQMTRIGYSEIRHELQWKKLPTAPPKQKEKSNPAIRKMPEYDPDADIASLTLTIPSWVSSIERSIKNTDFRRTSNDARNKLTQQLNTLKYAVGNIEKSIKEES